MSKKQQTKTVQLKKKEEEVSGSEESEEQPTTKAPVAPKTVAKKKEESSEEDESEDEKPKAKTTDKGKVVPAKNAPTKATPTKATPAKKKEESSEEDESEEVVAPKTNVKGTTTKAPAKTATPVKTPAKKKEESSEEDESEEEVKVPAKKGTTAKTPAKPTTPAKTPAKKKEESSEEDESEEEVKVPAKKGTTTTPKKTGKQDKMEESEESESDELHIVKAGDKTATPAQKRKREPERDTNSKKPKFGGSSGGSSGGNTKVRLGNLSFELDGKEDEIRAMFEDCGTINSVELIKRQDQSFAGVAIIEFDSMDACNKAIEKHDEEFYGRKMNLSMAKESGAKGGARGKGPSEKPEGCTTVFIGNLSYQVTEEEVRDFFSSCGKIQDVRWPKGDFTGIGWVEFEDTSSVDEAVKLAGQNLAGRMIRVDYAAPRKTQNKW